MIIDVSLTGQTLTASAPQLAGESINKLFCSLTVDHEWKDLAITLVFRLVHPLGTITRAAVVNNLRSVVVPHEVIKSGYLYIGAVGVAQNGAVRLTTAEMRQPLKLDPAEATTADPEGSVSATVADQLRANIGGLSNLDTADKSSLVAAINELLGRVLQLAAIDPQTAADLAAIAEGLAMTYREQTAVYASEDVMGSVTLGTGWSMAGRDLTHGAGNVYPALFEINGGVSSGDEFLITFDCDNLNSDYIFVSMGDGPLTQTYGFDSTAVVVKALEDNALVKITPTSNFSGTLRNLSIRKVTPDGTPYFVDSGILSNLPLSNLKTGFWDVIMGTADTLRSSPNSSRTIAIGHAALRNLISGNRNIALGTFAMRSTLSGESNVCIGADGMIDLLEADNCIALGKGTMQAGKKASYNVAIGPGAMAGSAGAESSGSIAIGQNAGHKGIGTGNIYIGNGAGFNNARDSNVVIGTNAFRNTSNSYWNVIIGNGAANTPSKDQIIGCIVLGESAETPSKHYQTIIGTSKTVETKVYGDFIVAGTDGVKRKILFNSDGTCSWVAAE